VSFTGTHAPSLELHRSKETSSQQSSTNVTQQTCGVQDFIKTLMILD